MLSYGQIVMDSNSELWNCKITRQIPTTGSPSISLATTTGGENIRIQNCFFEKNRTAIYINPGAINLQINRNKFDDNRTSILVPDGGGANITNLQITGNNIANSRTFGILFHNGTFSIDATLTHNNITGNNASAINIDNNNANTQIKLRNNWFGVPVPTIFKSSLTTEDSFSVSDHIEGYENNPNFYFGIHRAPNAPFYITGTNTVAIQGIPSTSPPTLIHASIAQPDYSTSFVPISIETVAAYTTIQDAINNAITGNNIFIPDGIYDEDVNINKPVNVTGTSQENTIIRGLFTGSAHTVQVGSNATLTNLTVTRDYGTTIDEWKDGSKSQGIILTGNGATIDGVKVVGNRNGIYVNNIQNFTIKNNKVISNRTGLQIANNISGGSITNNIITENFTHGLMLNFVNGPVNADNLTIRYNSFSGNWFSEIYFQGNNSGTFTGANFTCNNFNTTAISKQANAAGEPEYPFQLPPHLGGTPPAAPAIILRGTKINDFKHAPWLNVYPDADPVTAGYQLPTEYTVEPATGILSSSNNNFRVLANAIGCAVNGDKITLNGTFDYSESNALVEWRKGIDGDISTTGDNYAILIDRNLTDIELTATHLGAAKIQGPGDVESTNLESFLSLTGLEHTNWKISNLEISGFDLSIGYMSNKTNASEIKIFNNQITVPKDLTEDSGQNIALHLTKGLNQKIYSNKIYIEGDGVGIDAQNKSTSLAIQSFSTGAQHVDGLRIHDNEIIVTGQPDDTEPAYIIGIWENTAGTNASVEIFNNKFSNEDAGNQPQNNRQMAFRVTPRSGETKNVIYHHNEIYGFNRAIDWLGDPFSAYNPSAYNVNARPVIIRNNIIDNVQYGITPRKSAASTNTGAPAIIEHNQITNIAENGYAISYTNGGILSATCNWFGFEPDETDRLDEINALVPGTAANRTIIPYLFSGENNATIGFEPLLSSCSAPVKRVAPLEYFATIQEAIDDSETQATHVIEVEPFKFHNVSQILVNKSVTISGNNGNTSKKPKLAGVSNGGGSNEARFNVTVSNVTIDNFDIEVDLSGFANTGIRAANTGGALTISNNLITAIHANEYPVWTSFGVDVGNQESGSSTEILMNGNDIKTFGRGVRLTRTRGTVSKYILKGIYALNAGAYSVGGDLVVEDNEFTGSVSMVESGSAGNDNLVIQSNTFYPIAESASYESLYLLQVRGNNKDKPVNISANTFQEHKSFGIFIGSSGNITIDNNNFTPSGSDFVNIGWNSKSETRALNPPPYAAIGFTVINNQLNGTGGTGISFANHNSGNAIIPLSGILIGSAGNENTFDNNLANFIVLDENSGGSSSLPLWNSGGFAGSYVTTMAPFAVDFFVPYNHFGELGIGSTMDYSKINEVEAKIIDKDDINTLGQVFIKAPVKNIDLGKFYLAIQPAIDEADNENTIEVEPVTFDHESSINVNKPVHLKGISDPDAPKPILTGTGDPTTKARFYVTSPDVTIDNFEILVSGENNDMVGIKTSGEGTYNNLLIKNNKITNLASLTDWNTYGIFTGSQNGSGYDKVTITENEIGAFGRGVRLERVNGMLSENTIDAIHALSVAGYSAGEALTITDNNFYGSVNMIESVSSTFALNISNNIFDASLATTGDPYYLLQIRENRNETPAVIQGNQFLNHSTFGVFIARSGNVTVHQNVFEPSSATYTNIAWNSKSESTQNPPVPYAASKFSVTGNTLKGAGGKDISFANHLSGSFSPLTDIVIGTQADANQFIGTPLHYIYLDKQTGSTNNEADGVWTSSAFNSAKESVMAPFDVPVFAGFNLFASSSTQAFNLTKDDLLPLETYIHDKDDSPLVGQVFFRSVWNGNKNLHYATIQEAVDNADDTNELTAYGWEYHEDVDVNKSVILKGSNLDATDNRPLVKNNGGTVRFMITKPDVTIDNFRIEVSENGTDLTGIKTGMAGTYNNLILKNNLIENTGEGKWASYGIFCGSQSPSNNQDQISLNGNIVRNFGRGARLERVFGLISGNTFEGIYALNVAPYSTGGNLTVEENNFHGSVSMIGSNNNTNELTIHNNTFDASQTDTNPFYLLQIRDNGNQTPVNITQNIFLNHEEFGIFVGRSGNVHIDDNTFTPAGTTFTNIGWNSKSETSGDLGPFAADGFTLTNNTFNGTGGTGISFSNDHSDNAIVPLSNILIGTNGNDNIFGNDLGKFIVLENKTGNSNLSSLWMSDAFIGSVNTQMAPFKIDLFAGNNRFGDGATASTLGYSQIQEIELKVTDKDDLAVLGQVFFKTPVHNITQSKSYQTIQAAISEAVSGDQINLDEWQYIENVVIETSGISIEGTGNMTETVLRPAVICSGIATINDGITINTSNIQIKNLKITQFRNGIVANGEEITLDEIEVTGNCYNGVSVKNGAHNLSITNSKLNANLYGLQAGTTVSANNLTIENSEVKGNNRIGLIIENGASSGSTFNDARFINVDFSDNKEKGIYLEKANNLLMDGLLVNNCGTMDEQYLVNQGIDINLKYGNFSTITLKNSTITNSGAAGHTTTQPNAPAAISIKARNDGSYSTNPATLNNVLIENNIIHGIVHGLRIGEYGTSVNTGPTNVVIQNNAFTGSYTGKALINTTSAIPNANCNWWDIANLTAIQAKISGNVLITTFLNNGNSNVTTTGFIPVANCNAGRADFTISLITGASSLQAGESTNLLVRIENVSLLPQSENIVFAVSKVETDFSLTFDPAVTQVMINSVNRNVQNGNSNLTVTNQTNRYLITINAAQVIAGGGTFNLSFGLKANAPSASGNITGLISAVSDDNGNNNSGNIIVVSN